MAIVEERIGELEQALKDFTKNVGIEFNKVYNLQAKSEIEFVEFKNEMKEFKNEMRQQTRDMNKTWGEIANKMGTIVEDIAAPSIPRVLKEEFNIELDFFGIRIKKRLKDGKEKEFDCIATAGNYVYLNSTKSTLRKTDIDDFIEDIKEFRKFFPEYQKKKIIGIFASLYIDNSIIKNAEKKGFMILSLGDHLMELKNTKGFKPKEW